MAGIPNLAAQPIQRSAIAPQPNVYSLMSSYQTLSIDNRREFIRLLTDFDMKNDRFLGQNPLSVARVSHDQSLPAQRKSVQSAIAVLDYSVGSNRIPFKQKSKIPNKVNFDRNLLVKVLNAPIYGKIPDQELFVNRSNGYFYNINGQRIRLTRNGFLQTTLINDGRGGTTSVFSLEPVGSKSNRKRKQQNSDQNSPKKGRSKNNNKKGNKDSDQNSQSSAEGKPRHCTKGWDPNSSPTMDTCDDEKSPEKSDRSWLQCASDWPHTVNLVTLQKDLFDEVRPDWEEFMKSKYELDRALISKGCVRVPNPEYKPKAGKNNLGVSSEIILSGDGKVLRETDDHQLAVAIKRLRKAVRVWSRTKTKALKQAGVKGKKRRSSQIAGTFAYSTPPQVVQFDQTDSGYQLDLDQDQEEDANGSNSDQNVIDDINKQEQATSQDLEDVKTTVIGSGQ